MNKHLVTCLVALSGCMTGPLNGDTTTDRNKSFVFQGYFNLPATPVDVQYLADATSDPTVDGNWSSLATITTTTEPTYFHDPSPLYYWSLSAVPGQQLTEVSWPIGGLLHLRAVSNGRVLTIFDQDFGDCFSANSTQSWEVIGNTCRSAFGSAAIVADSEYLPSKLDSTVSYLDRRGVDDYSSVYYNDVFPPFEDGSPNYFRGYDLDEAVSVGGQGYPLGLSVSFYNDGDLGTLRRVSCRDLSDHIGPGEVWCMADNFGAFEGGANQPQAAWQSADFIVTSANNPATDPDATRFAAFTGNDQHLTGTVKFGTVGTGTPVPNACMECHGGRYDANYHVVGARLLPLDPAVIRPLPGADPAAWQESVRQLNSLIMRRGAPTAAMADVVNGEYHNAVNTPGTTADPGYVPAGWSDTAAHTKLYNAVVKPYCRSCHDTLSPPGNPGAPASLNFSSFADFYSFRSSIAYDVCQGHQMPNSQHAQNGLWRSAGRAYLVEALGINSGCGAKGPIAPMAAALAY